jgi:hypothetical protein
MGQAFDDVHAVYCYFGSGIILSGVSEKKVKTGMLLFFLYRQSFEKFMKNLIGVQKMLIHKI